MSFRTSTSAFVRRSTRSSPFPSPSSSSTSPLVRLQTRTAISSQPVPRIIGRKRDKDTPIEKSLFAKIIWMSLAVVASGVTVYQNNPWNPAYPGAGRFIPREERELAKEEILNSEAFRKAMMEGKLPPPGQKVEFKPVV